MLYSTERKKLAKKIGQLKDLGILNPEGGGIAVRLTDGMILVSPTGGAFRLWEVQPEDILVTDLSGKIVEKGKYLAIAELPIDLYIFANYPLANAVFHLHGPYSLAFASLCLPIPHTTNHVEILGEVPCLKSPDETKLKREYLANSFKVNIPEAVVYRPEVFLVFDRLIKEFNNCFGSRGQELDKHGLAFTVEKHGLFVFARNLDEAIENAVRVEGAARTAIFSKLIIQHAKN
ncbi:hypothetical protein A2721_00415 [Candidatus Gottesmanbacteria bacterium RIFCSPHIGHO2_01_FULL_47_48]|uniref:Class II aldolase/adducin N-terminal domain-containing protein n=1 Tax=Candidatus Gottesmanbacteria bacterium RIFCSPHIGHO2_01_FULL_47_48 TaxID=1798381 RepID=A0A1F6A179_9BACT|nr:MAG: hypothetical protein A2721_00415 [Candidatus Gottesmanbacteria bacterium RIFCSPHIGHO2_01_FULL_47_48]